TLGKLTELQTVNQALDALRSEILYLKAETEKEEKKHEFKKHQYEKVNEEFILAKKDFDLVKLEVDEIKEQMKTHEKKKKNIKTIKEFNALNSEIEALGKKRAMRESKLISKQDDLEFRESKLKTLDDSIKEIQARIDEKQKEADKLIKERKSKIDAAQKEKDTIEKKLDSFLVEKFNRIYRNKNQVSIVPIRDQVCGGCFMQLPHQIENNVRKMEEIIFCPCCSRILYIDETA
ncbi:MAG TPA: hypothetical protein DC049_12985, partial [Spirochaetia bacterium]|nr:hypothetical protein [Spirochaetia bacterium]